MKKKGEREEILSLLKELPDGFTFGDGGEAKMPAAAINAQALKVALDAFERGVGLLAVARVYEADEVIERPSVLEMELGPVLEAVERIYAFIACRTAEAGRPGNIGRVRVMTWVVITVRALAITA